MSKEQIHADVELSKATEMVRSQCVSVARQQGGTELHLSQEYTRPATSAEDIAGGDPPNSGGSGMGTALGEYRPRTDQEWDDYFDMD